MLNLRAMHARIRGVLCCVALLVSSCGGPSYPTFHHLRAGETLEPSVATSGPEVAELVERFYAPDADLPSLEPELARLLERYPASAALHEMAAEMAELHESSHEVWLHWMQAAADLSSPLTELYLDRALGSDLTVREADASIRLLTRLAEVHPRYEARVDAARYAIRLLSQREAFAEAERLTPMLGYLNRWKILGAFDNDQGRGFLARETPEQGIDLDAEMQGVLVPIRWRDVTAIDRTGVVHLDDHVSPQTWTLAYLLTHVRLPQDTDLQVRMSTSTGVRVWVDGRLIVSQERAAHEATDNIIVPISLAAGWHRILVKSAQDDGGDWTFGMRLTDAQGAPIAGIEEDAALHDVTMQAEGEASSHQSTLAGALDELTPELRRQLLFHHDHARCGYMADALTQAREMIGVAPEHPLALHHAALTHWTSEELGQAIDFLNAVVERTAGWGAGPLYQRGAFYRGRQRYDVATEDLRAAVEMQPRARFARMELALTFENRSWYEDQCRTLADAAERFEDSGWAWRALGWCWQTRNYLDRAQEHFARADAMQPGNAWNLGHLATQARWRNDHAAAIRYAERMLALEPWSGNRYVELGDYLRLAGQRDRARQAYEEARRRDPDSSAPWHRLGMMALEDNDSQEALRLWTEQVARDPDNSRLAERVDFMRGGSEEADPLVPTQQQIDQAVARATQMEIDPGAHTVLVLDDEVTDVQRDGSAMHRITQVHLAVTTDGRDELIATQVPSNARILSAYAVSPSGQRQEAASIRGGVIRFRGLDVGSRLVLQYTYHAQPPAFLPNHHVASWIFQGIHRQLGEARWVVRVPAGRQLAMHVQGPIEHRVERVGEQDVHWFTASNTPPLVPEPQMPPVEDLIAMVTLSTLTTWDEYAQWERALLTEVFEANDQLRGLARRLTEGATTPRERLDRLFHYVAEEIRYQQDYESTIAGVRPHSCPVVLERGYGDCKDKAVLLILLAREVGLDLRFAVLRTTNAGRVVREVPNQQFNHAIVYVPPQQGIERGLFMDPTTDGLDLGNLRSDDQGATALVLEQASGRYEFIEIPYAAPDRERTECTLEVSVASAEQGTANSRCRWRGGTGSALRQILRNEERARQLRQSIANGFFNGANVQSHAERNHDDIRAPVEMDLGIDLSASIQAEQTNRRVHVPSLFTLAAATRLESRRTPLRLGPPDSSHFVVRMELPARARVVRTPEPFRIEHRCFRMTRTTQVQGRVVTVTTDYERTCPEIPPEEYPEVRRLAQRASSQLNADVVFTP